MWILFTTLVSEKIFIANRRPNDQSVMRVNNFDESGIKYQLYNPRCCGTGSISRDEF